MFPPTRRLNYFDHQFLRVDDFTDEQAYHLGMRRAHNRLLHAPGVAQGLAVAHAGSTLTVSPGVALDGEGREIVLKEPAELPVPPDAGGTAWVTLAYGERRVDPTTETGAAGDRRWEEVPALRLETAVPDDPETRLVLGRVTLSAGRVTRIDDGDAPVHRRVAGPAPGAELEVRSLAVQGSAAIGGALTVERTLSVGGAEGGATLNLPGGRSFATTDGDLTVGTGNNRLSVGVEVDGAAAGTARLRAEGAAPRLVLGAAGTDVLTVQPGGVGIGAAPAAGVALTVEGALDATELRQNGVPVVSLQWAAATGGIAYMDGRVGVGTNAPEVPLHVIGTRLRLQNADGDKYLDLRTDGSELDLHSTGGALFVHTGLSGEALHLNAFGGNVGVGTGMVAATARLQVAGGNGDLGATEGDFKVGDDTYRLKVGVTTAGIGGGDVRMRAVGGTQKLMLGGGANDVLTVTETAVGVGTTTPGYRLHVLGTDRAVGTFESKMAETLLTLTTSEGVEKRVEFCNRPGGIAAIWAGGTSDALQVYRDGRVIIPNTLSVGSIEVTGRLTDNRIRREVGNANKISITNTSNTENWQDIPDLNLTQEFKGGPCLVRFHMGGVQTQGVDEGRARFRLLVNDTTEAYTLEEYHHSIGFSLRGVSLERLLWLKPGTYRFVVQWTTQSPKASTTTPITLTGGFYNDNRTLIVIEL